MNKYKETKGGVEMNKAGIWVIVFLLMATVSYGANGDLIVDGNAGIGTTSPTRKLQIGDTSESIISFKTGNVERSYIGSSADSSGGKIRFFTLGSDGTTFSEKMRITNNGNVGIGAYTVPTSVLQVEKEDPSVWTTATNSSYAYSPYPQELTIKNGQDNVTGSFTGLFFYAGETANGSQINSARITAIREAPVLTSLAFSVRGSDYWVREAMRINSSGNVGVGTSSIPQNFKFYVNGLAGGTQIWQGSDANFKKNIQTIDAPIDKILRMQGVSYEWKKDYNDKNFPDGRYYGVLAQDMENVLPEAVKTTVNESTGLNEKMVDYSQITAVLIEAIKAQQTKIVALEADVAKLKAK